MRSVLLPGRPVEGATVAVGGTGPLRSGLTQATGDTPSAGAR